MQDINISRFIRNLLALAALSLFAASPAWSAAVKHIHLMGQTVLEMPLADGVGLDDAVASLKERANELNFKLVAELPLSKQVEVMTGKPQKRMTIFEFCDPMTAVKMVHANMAFAAFLPCRIALVEGKDGKGYLVMLSLNDLIKAARLSPQLKPLAVEVRDKLVNIMKAGANGDL